MRTYLNNIYSQHNGLPLYVSQTRWEHLPAILCQLSKTYHESPKQTQYHAVDRKHTCFETDRGNSDLVEKMSYKLKTKAALSFIYTNWFSSHLFITRFINECMLIIIDITKLNTYVFYTNSLDNQHHIQSHTSHWCWNTGLIHDNVRMIYCIQNHITLCCMLRKKC